jgi:hypothetical protein
MTIEEMILVAETLQKEITDFATQHGNNIFLRRAKEYASNCLLCLLDEQEELKVNDVERVDRFIPLFINKLENVENIEDVVNIINNFFGDNPEYAQGITGDKLDIIMSMSQHPHVTTAVNILRTISKK